MICDRKEKRRGYGGICKPAWGYGDRGSVNCRAIGWSCALITPHLRIGKGAAATTDELTDRKTGKKGKHDEKN